MEKSRVSEILDEIGTLLELRGENPFKCRAYHNAARAIEGITGDLARMVQSGEIRNVKGIGEAIAEQIGELLSKGKSKYHEELKASLPPGLMKMLRISGVGPKKVKMLYEKLGITSIEELEAACKAGKLEKLEGFGKKTEENILTGIEALRKHSSKFLYSVAEKSALFVLHTHNDLVVRPCCYFQFLRNIVLSDDQRMVTSRREFIRNVSKYALSVVVNSRDLSVNDNRCLNNRPTKSLTDRLMT